MMVKNYDICEVKLSLIFGWIKTSEENNGGGVILVMCKILNQLQKTYLIHMDEIFSKDFGLNAT